MTLRKGISPMRHRSLAASLVAALAFTSLAGASGPEAFGIANATFPEPGVMAAGQPTGEQLQLLAEEGYKTVIDLRTAEEPHGFDEPQAARENGMAYVNVPVTAQTLDQATIDQFSQAMKKAEKPVLLHCGTSNRVGALYYAWLVQEKGLSAKDALAKAKAAGLRSPELIEKVDRLLAERKPDAQK
jgi:uncharacterized protein (TIGR01244 family)